MAGCLDLGLSVLHFWGYLCLEERDTDCFQNLLVISACIIWIPSNI
jgi:hypothetical protein